MKQAFAEDRIADWEVWNQPLRSYKVTEKREVTADEANRLIGVQLPAADGGVSDAGTSTGSYKFNARAVRFVQVSLQVRYISESSASTGYTGNNIDWYTHSDYYSYVLELDGAGKIIGGEWLGSSKLSHPDFLWLPLGPGSSTVAGGAISYEKVKALVLESAGPVIAPGPTVEVNETATIAQGDWKHFGPYTTASGPITVDMTGTGDADLYVRLNGQPTFDLYDCRPYGSDSNESCTLNGPGPVSVSVHAYAAATVALKVKFTTAAASDAGTPRVDAGTPRVDAGTPRFDAGSRPDGG